MRYVDAVLDEASLSKQVSSDCFTVTKQQAVLSAL
jgi:hypothetical protein